MAPASEDNTSGYKMPRQRANAPGPTPERLVPMPSQSKEVVRHKRTKVPGVYYSVGKAGRKTWEVRYTDSTGKRVWETVESFEAAKARLAEVTGRKMSGQRVASVSTTVSDLLPGWRDWRKVKPRTEETQERHVRLYIENRWGRTKARDIVRADIVTWLRTMKKQNGGEMNDGTKAVILSTFSSILDYAVQADVLAANPCRSLGRRDKPRASAKEARIYTREELAALIEANNRRPWMQEILRFTVLTGLRLGEVCGLTWGQVDFEKGVLVIDRQLGKDGRVGTPKGGVTATMPMIPDVRKMLAERHLAAGRPTEGPVFPNSTGAHRHPRDVQNAFGRARARAKLSSDPRALTFHDLRHTCASMMANMPGAVLPQVQAYLRHGKLTTTMGYIHRVENEEWAEQAGAALAGFGS